MIRRSQRNEVKNDSHEWNHIRFNWSNYQIEGPISDYNKMNNENEDTL